MTVFWVKFKTFGVMPLTLLFALAQAPLIMRTETKPRKSRTAIFSGDGHRQR
jgi:intracellular septation protein